MKPVPCILCVIFLFGFTLRGICQGGATPLDTMGRTLTFKDGRWLDPAVKAISPKSKSDTIFRGSINGSPYKLDDLKKQIYPKLLKAAQATLDSLNDPGTGLAAFYQAVFQGDYAGQVNSLKIIINHLTLPAKRDAAIDTGNAVTEKIDGTIKDLLPLSKYTVTSAFIGRSSAVEVKVYGDDLLKKFIQLYFKDCQGSFDKLIKTDGFIASRIELQRLLNEAVALPKINGYVCTGADPARLYKDSIENNILFKWFTAYTCKPDLFWMGGGSFRLTPYSAAVKYDWKKLQLFDRMIAFRIDSVKRCCDMDPVKAEALIRAINTGRKRFKSSGSAILGFKNRADIFTDQAFLNDLFIPVLLPENKTGQGYYSPYKQKFILNYDAARGYTLDQPYVRPAVAENEQILIGVNNITAGKTVIITGTDVTIDDKSKAQAALSDIGTSLAGAYTAISPIGSLGTLLQTNPVPVVPNPAINVQAFQQAVVRPRRVSGGGSTTYITTYEVRIEGIPLLQGKTNREILMTFISNKAPEEQAELTKAVDFFISNCPNVPFAGLSVQDYQAAVTKLTGDFTAFLTYSHDLSDRKQLAVDAGMLYYLIPNFDDAQPFEPLKEAKGTEPKYHTTLSAFDFIKAPKEKDYVITEEVLKPVKPGTTPKTIYDATAADSVKSNMTKGFFKVGKRYFVQVSGGIGISTHDYTQNSAAVSGNQLNITMNNQQVSFLIGLHFYPLKAFNLDNDFLGVKDAWIYHNRRVLKDRFWNHLSLYTGIGIPDPLKNFYGGLSLDLVPGVRVTGGAHFIIYTKYQVTNNVITDQANGFKAVSPFVGLNLDADFVGKLFSLFK